MPGLTALVGGEVEPNLCERSRINIGFMAPTYSSSLI
jgi:hypothetical protein